MAKVSKQLKQLIQNKVSTVIRENSKVVQDKIIDIVYSRVEEALKSGSYTVEIKKKDGLYDSLNLDIVFKGPFKGLNEVLNQRNLYPNRFYKVDSQELTLRILLLLEGQAAMDDYEELFKSIEKVLKGHLEKCEKASLDELKGILNSK